MRLGVSHTRVLILLCSFLLVSRSSIAQSGAMEDSVFIYRNASINATTDSIRLANNQLLINYLITGLKTENALEFTLNKTKSISVKSLPSAKARIITWNLEMVDYTNRFFGLIQHKTKNGILITELRVSKQINTNWEQSAGDAENWLGSVYYDVIPAQIKQRNCFILLGWRGKDRIISQKIIDIVYFDRSEVKFGLPVFKHGNTTKQRVIFTYPAEMVFSLKYNSVKKEIVFDRLVPSAPNLVGNYAFYTTALIFDAYKLDRKKWIFTQDVDVTGPERKKTIPPRQVQPPKQSK